MKIVSPERFKGLDLQKILGTNVWIENIREILRDASNNNYWAFLYLASSIQIVEYPGKIQLDTLEWAEMEEESTEIKNYDSILDYLIYSAKRNILSAKKIRITEESFDLIF